MVASGVKLRHVDESVFPGGSEFSAFYDELALGQVGHRLYVREYAFSVARAAMP